MPPNPVPRLNGLVRSPTRLLVASSRDKREEAGAGYDRATNCSYIASLSLLPDIVPFLADPKCKELARDAPSCPCHSTMTHSPLCNPWIVLLSFLCLLDVARAQTSPKFTQFIYSVSVPEDLEVGENVVNVAAQDADGDPVRYRFRPGQSFSEFAINATEGSITLASSLDRETRQTYSVVVQAIDNEIPPQTATAIVRVVVIDMNDNAPRFAPTVYRASVFDDDPTWNKIVVRVSATDADQRRTANAKIVYEIESTGNDNGTFGVTSSGDVIAVKSIDFDRRRRYDLTISARDDGKPQRASVNNASVRIDVLTSRYLTPLFSESAYVFNVSENASVPHDVGRVSATYFNWMTNGSLVYRLVAGNDDGLFDLGNRHGNLSVTKRLDRETSHVHNLVVEATDNRNSSYSQTVSVTVFVSDVNDNAPRLHASKPRTATISQNFPIGQDVFNVSCTDKDAWRKSPSITLSELNSSGLFGMDKGQVVLLKQISARQNTTYGLLVQCEDQGGLFDRLRFDVNVVLANDHAPRFIGTPYYVSVVEGTEAGGVVFMVTAHDDDRGPDGDVVFRLIDSSKTFRIDGINGTVYTTRELDRERQSMYSFVVVATDLGERPRSSSTIVTVRILNVNDNGPRCATKSFLTLVSEHMAEKNVALNLNCSDADGDVLSYSVIKASRPGVFIVNSNGDVVLDVDDLERRDDDVYTLDVRVDDVGRRSTNVSVVLRVERVNDFAPVFSGSGVFTMEISEDAVVDTAIMQITATDDDRGRDGDVSYEIVSGSGMGKFRIDDDGRIILVKSLDSETGDRELTLNVRARDGGGDDAMSATATVKLTVKDVNDNSPVISTDVSSTIRLLSSYPRGYSVLNVSCDDADVTTTKVMYKISGDEAVLRYLSIAAGDGSVSVGSSLAEVTKEISGEVTIVCSDDGTPPKTANKTVLIEIIPVVKMSPSTVSRSPATTPTKTNEATNDTVAGENGISLIVAVVGAVVGAIVAVVLIILVVWLCRWRRRT